MYKALQDLERIHEDFHQLIVNKQFNEAGEYVKQYIDYNTDNNILRTLLLLLKGLKAREEFKDHYEAITLLLFVKTGKHIL